MAYLRSLPRFDASITDEVVVRYLEALDCPRSLSVYLLYRYAEFDQLVSLDVSVNDYRNSESFRNAYLATSFLSKNRFLKTSFDLKKRALEKFEASEEQCAKTNSFWRSRNSSFGIRDWHAVSCVANKIYQILGPSPNIDEVVYRSSWGPGATTAIKAVESSSYKKFRDEHGITRDALSLVPYIRSLSVQLADRIFCIEPGDSIVVVPKNAKIGRVILKQPGWNLYLQKGVGKVIRSKLSRFGLDLDEADKINCQKAYSSSKDGELATIDFSSASDMIAIEPLREVLPPNWFELLDCLRSKRSTSGRYWNKFSSMGNGFTFELESLLFYVIGLVSCEIDGVDSSDVSVFGDDTILPVASVSTFRRICTLFGFIINEDKTFVKSPFRESCGAHFYGGVDTKPVYLRDKLSTIQHVYKFHNAIRLLASRTLAGYGCDRRWKSLCDFLTALPRGVFSKLKIPPGFGDVGFISNFDEATPQRLRFGHQGYSFLALIDIPEKQVVDEPPLIMVRLTEHSDAARNNAIERKGRTLKSLQRLRVFEWNDLGPWI